MPRLRPRRTILIQAALNGDRTRQDHPAVPLTGAELVRDAVACVAAGAGAIHLHPRGDAGRETLKAGVVDQVVIMTRSACHVPVGVTTGEWIEPDLDRRVALVRGWREPDYASVNLSEPGAIAIMGALTDAGVGIEAGIWSVEDAELLAGSGFASDLVRVLVEPTAGQVDGDSVRALALVDEIHGALDRCGVTAPRLQHGDGPMTWPLLIDALRRGLDTRIGLEDTLHDRAGAITGGNAALVEEAVALRANRSEGQRG